MYFNHPYAMRNTPEILELRASLGFESYSIYLMVLETMAESPDHAINGKLVNGLSIGFGCDIEFLKKVLTKCVDLKLFYVKGDFICSNHLKQHFEKRAEIKEKRVKAGAKGGKAKANSSNSLANAKQNLANAKQNLPKESKESKIKENKIKKDKYLDSVYLSEEEHKKLESEYGTRKTKKLIEHLNNYKEANGKTYKSDYHAILNWVVRAVEQEEAKKPKGLTPSDVYGYRDDSEDDIPYTPFVPLKLTFDDYDPNDIIKF